MVWLDLSSGLTRPARCGRLACPDCVVHMAWRRSLAIGLAQPARAMTITQVAPAGTEDPWPLARQRINRTREWLKRQGVAPGEWNFQVEHNPNSSEDTGYHAHVWQHGSFIPKSALQDAAHHAGAGWTRIDAMRSSGPVSYGLKGIGYGMKGAAEDADPVEYLRLNGGRLTHQSRGFFRGPQGGAIGVRPAERLALTTKFGEDTGTWTLTTATSAGSWAWAVLGIVTTAGLASATPTPGSPPEGGSPAGGSAP